MNLEDIDLFSTIGVEQPDGTAVFFTRTRKGLEGPFLDRDCQVPYMPPDLQAEIDRNARAHRVYRTGKTRRLKELTMSDGTAYKTTKDGVLRRLTPKLSKKERKALAKESRIENSEAGAPAETLREEVDAIV